MPEPVPKFAVPDEIRINPSFVIVKLPVFKVPPVTSKPALLLTVTPDEGSIEKLPPTGMVIKPPVNVILPPPETEFVPLMVNVVFISSLFIISSSNTVFPLIVVFEDPVNSTVPLVPALKVPLLVQFPYTLRV